MIKIDSLIFTKEDNAHFREWVKLKLEEVTWQGRYSREFELFWESFFVEGLSLEQINDRFEYSILNSKVGPLSTWFNWLRQKLICYIFTFKKLDIQNISSQMDMPVGNVAGILRNFFLEKYPHLDDELSEVFQVANIASPNLLLNFRQLSEQLQIFADKYGTSDDDVMASLEVTLYPEFMDLIKKIKKDFLHPHFDFSRIKTNLSFKNQLRIIQEVLVFVFVGILIVIGVKYANQVWEKSLTDKISIYEPQLKWLNRNLVFKKESVSASKDFLLEAEELENVENLENKFDTIVEEDEVRYDVESEVVLTSWDTLPKDFDTADLEQSDYEEQVSGYRDSRYGHTKVYRVMMKSEDTIGYKDKLNSLLSKYEITQVDNVRPGKEVPGGVYYNLYVPRVNLKEFMAQVMDMGDAVLYESRTRSGRNPAGKNKVFIWIKNI